MSNWHFFFGGGQDARRCSYLGELDSAEEESDETSDEFEFSHEIVGSDGRRLSSFGQGGDGSSNSSGGDPDRHRNGSSGLDSERARGVTFRNLTESYLKELNTLSRQELLRRLLRVSEASSGPGGAAGGGPSGGPGGENGTSPAGYVVRQVDEVDAELPDRSGRLPGTVGEEEVAQDGEREEEEDVAGEVLDIDDDDGLDVYDLHDRGAFDQVHPASKDLHPSAFLLVPTIPPKKSLLFPPDPA